jgi:hypothetical protein
LGTLPKFVGPRDPRFPDNRLKFLVLLAAPGMARNLNVAVQPAVADACWPMSKMDFRSNEADRDPEFELKPA